MVFRWLKRGLQLDTLISVSPKGVEMQVAGQGAGALARLYRETTPGAGLEA